MPERGLDSSWMPLATKFPPTLVKDRSPELLKDGERPNAIYVGIDEPGYLYFLSSAPGQGTAWNERATITTPTNAPAEAGISTGWIWHHFHNRPWSWAGPTVAGGGKAYLYYGAFGYSTRFLWHGVGKLFADDESAVIKGLAPFGNSLAIIKASYLYVIDNASNPGDDFVVRRVNAYDGMSSYDMSYNKVIDIDGVLYIVNTNGVWSYDGRELKELTFPVRNNLGTFKEYQGIGLDGVTYLRADFYKRRLIGWRDNITRFIIDLNNGGLYDYRGSSIYTTPTFISEGREPVMVSEVGLGYKLNSGTSATFKLEVLINDTWKDEGTLTISTSDSNGWASFGLENVLQCRRFAVRVSEMDSDLRVSGIYARVKQGGLKGF